MLPKLQILLNVNPEVPFDIQPFEKIVKKAILGTLKYEHFTKKAVVSLSFVNNEVIREVNREYRQIDKATDVLSFPQYEAHQAINETMEPVMLGDIMINLDRAEEQAKELGHSHLREVAFLAIHSTLHLLGYDHVNNQVEEEDMCKRQREIVSNLKLDKE